MSGAVAVFVYADWIKRYPEFADTVDEDLGRAFFAEASVYHRNDGAGPVSDATVQTIILYALTAHVAQLNAGSSLQPASPLVGRLSNVTEGSVSVQVDNEIEPGTSQWYQQTRYGASYWSLTLPYRTFRYHPGRTRSFAPPFSNLGGP